jgi:small GTP-binding protein
MTSSEAHQSEARRTLANTSGSVENLDGQSDLVRRVQALRARVQSAGDMVTADKLGHLADRAAAPQGIVVAFVGLFSAGKSSLINALCESQRMATGAVPTTAEVAEVALPGTDGRVTLLDTPGIDSTDDAHQAATEAALYRADVVVLVMDYQHVESDANLEWAYQFSGSGKRLVLVVNQVDKHLEWEIPFATFQSRIERTLDDWEIRYDRLFFTSSHDHPHNQLANFAAWLRELPAGTDSAHNVVLRGEELISEHLAWRFGAQLEDQAQKVREALALPPGVDVLTEVDVTARRSELAARLQELSDKVEAVRQTVQDEFDETLARLLRSIELAQIAPYDTTEKGRRFVESLRPDFRVGWLRAEERTERERNARLTAFREDLAQRAEKYMIWPLKAELREFVAASEWVDEDGTGDIEALAVHLDDGWLRQMVRTGALVSEQYPYQYVKDVVGALKGDLRAQVKAVFERWHTAAQPRLEARLQPMTAERDECERVLGVLDEWLALMGRRQAVAQELRSLLRGDAANSHGTDAPEEDDVSGVDPMSAAGTEVQAQV